MAKYLYGLSIKGIQDFIFQTNKLKEIVGASEWLEEVCAERIEKILWKQEQKKVGIRLQAAAGEIKYLFEENERVACEKVVLELIQNLKQEIPDLFFNQAVIELDENADFATNFRVLDKLLQTKRNESFPIHQQGLMISKRSNRTGRLGIRKSPTDNTIWDRTQEVLNEKANGTLLFSKVTANKSLSNIKFPKDITDITQGKDKTWIAVVHADGNDMGASIRKIFGKTNSEHILNAYKTFSKGLQAATIRAVQKAFKDEISIKRQDGGTEVFVPFRPIIIGGDDVTFIMRGDLAIPFTAAYLRYFKQGTKQLFDKLRKDYGDIFTNDDYISACAGIAFIKPNYPFHYGATLAEELTKEAKRRAETLAKSSIKPSCLMFHKVQDSFVEDYGDIMERELFAKAADTKFDFGPYFVKDEDHAKNYATVEELLNRVETVQQEDAPSGSIRQWLRALHENEAVAKNQWELLQRLDNYEKYKKRLALDEKISRENYTHLYDVLSLSSIHQTQK